MKEVKRVTAITPVWNEPLKTIQNFLNEMDEVRRELAEKEIALQNYFLDDAALHLPENYPVLVKHEENQRLARTLVDGYKAICDLKPKPDLVVRLDCQEHDSGQIPLIVEQFLHSKVEALFLPVIYWVKGQERPLMREITASIADFCASLSPIQKEVVLATYNQKFPLGYQVFRMEALEEIVPSLEEGIKIFQEKFGQPSWGLDLLSILLAADKYPQNVDFLLGGWSEPWLENRGSDKVEAQYKKAAAMIEVALALGCRSLESGSSQ